MVKSCEEEEEDLPRSIVLDVLLLFCSLRAIGAANVCPHGKERRTAAAKHDVNSPTTYHMETSDDALLCWFSKCSRTNAEAFGYG